MKSTMLFMQWLLRPIWFEIPTYNLTCLEVIATMASMFWNMATKAFIRIQMQSCVAINKATKAIIRGRCIRLREAHSTSSGICWEVQFSLSEGSAFHLGKHIHLILESKHSSSTQMQPYVAINKATKAIMLWSYHACSIACIEVDGYYGQHALG